MLKINYPGEVNSEERKTFEEDYLKVFEKSRHSSIENKINTEIKKNESLKKLVDGFIAKSKHKGLNYIKYILIAPFDEIKKIVEVDSNFCQTKFGVNYASSKVRGFFYEKHEIINLHTCYYCNIDYVNHFEENVVNLKDFDDELDFLKKANYDEQIKFVEGFNDTDTREILKFYIEYIKENDSNSLGDIRRILSDNIKELTKIVNDGKKDEKIKSEKAVEKLLDKSSKVIETFVLTSISKPYGLFDLDHFIGKAKYPLFSLSLYNFVPSCKPCNGKTLKGENEFKNTLSPTSDNFNFDNHVKFRLFLKNEKKQTADKKDTQLDLEAIKAQLRYYSEEGNYREYEKIFKTNDRYSFHKREIDDLIEKSKKYPPSRIQEMAELLKMSPDKIKKDIFGEEIFDDTIKPEEKPFTKLKRDIAEQIGLL